MHLEGLYEGSKLVGKDRKLEEVRQDLLRAMLLFCSATLDAVLQRLLQDSLPDLIRANPDARRDLAKFADKLIRSATSESNDQKEARRILAESLTSDFGGSYRIARYRVEKLKNTSFQSFANLCEGSAVLGVSCDHISRKKEDLMRIFKSRNDIVHRMDIPSSELKSLSAATGLPNTAERNREQVILDCKTLLEVASTFVKSVDEKLPLEDLSKGGKFFS